MDLPLMYYADPILIVQITNDGSGNPKIETSMPHGLAGYGDAVVISGTGTYDGGYDMGGGDMTAIDDRHLRITSVGFTTRTAGGRLTKA
jgi:hypothetical protein